MAKAKSQKPLIKDDVAADIVQHGDIDILQPTQPVQQQLSLVQTKDNFSSDGVADNDVLNLPGSDYQIMIALTVLAAAIRLFRIYQPSSVVFDEVQ